MFFDRWQQRFFSRSCLSLLFPDLHNVADLGFLIGRKLLLEDVSLEHPLLEQTVLKKQLLDDLIAKVEVIDAVSKLLLWYDVAATGRAIAFDCKSSFWRHFNDFFHPEDLILAEKVELECLLLVSWD